MKGTIAVLPGDGIGPEVMREAVRVLRTVADKYGHQFELKEGTVGGAAYDKFQCHMPEETLQLCASSDAILFGSVGGPISEMQKPKWIDCERNSILALRKHFRFAVNLRPARIYPDMTHISPLKQSIVAKGVDILIVRELLGDAYFGKHESSKRDGVRYATDESEYNEEQVKVAAHAAFNAARRRSKRLTSVDKANVLTTSRLWREVVHEVAQEYKDVELSDMLVDNCAMQLILNPGQFDVIVTSNMFGDILSDAAAALPGSLGLVSSASLTDNGFGLYEPPGGSAQDIAGKGVANPIAQILSASMLLRYSFNLIEEAKAIDTAVESALKAGYRTGDIYAGNQTSYAKQVYTDSPEQGGGEKPAEKLVGTKPMTDAILQQLEIYFSQTAKNRQSNKKGSLASV